MRGVNYHKKCPLCGKTVFRKHFTYCPSCSRFVRRLDASHLSPQAIQSILNYVRTYGFVCFYTGMALDLKDPKNPFYCVFDHWNPGDDGKIVLTSFLINDMKTELSAAEFWYFIEQFFNFRENGVHVRKRKLQYWQGFYRDEGNVLKVRRKCCVCGASFYPAVYNQKYCHRCAELIWRMEIKKYPASTKKQVLDYIREHGYVCYYTGMKLDHDPRSPWYAVLDHWMPGNPKKVVLTSALFNSMKTDLTEREFWYYIEQLYNHYKKHTKVIKKWPIYWFRLYPEAKCLAGDV